MNGRIATGRLLWWLEQRDAAITLGMKPRVFMALPREARVCLLTAALKAREAAEASEPG